MNHRLVTGISGALGWDNGPRLGKEFTRGTLPDVSIAERVLTPTRLLDMVMRRSLANPQFRIFRNGAELHPDAYLNRDVTSRGQAVSMVNMRRVKGHLDDGATMILDRANVFDPTLEVICRAIQWWSGERVTVNIYLTTNDSAGFGLHWDDHNVIAIQLSGEKEWEVRGASRTAPMYRDAARNDTPSQDVIWSGITRPGDVLHIPRGHWHQAGRSGLGVGHSLHMTIGFTNPTGVGWLAWLADWSREDEVFRHDLDVVQDLEQQVEQIRKLSHATSRLVAFHSPKQFLAKRLRDVASTRHVPFTDLFGPLDDVVCVTEFPPRIDERGEQVEVVASGKKLTFAAKALPALRLLLSGCPVNLDQAAGVVGALVKRVAEILTEEELCASLTPELSSGYTGLVTNATH
ncbi:cupin domain-containing protein [Streptomyces sp. DSM 44915]|uniref:Cupin domain-containing protein n=1 Tax=Streptomyces chisholmiae TaxID=3075540 RepID=A0ABU2JT97_9ACTN|nr:cupin domain-containing protein [Streptomyces sp. DSM 44915]MDT0267954.1 cupin domain-containing protein [Streptomyces sp. DSM 44915]